MYFDSSKKFAVYIEYLRNNLWRMKNTENFVWIVTVPHGKCVENAMERTCDLSASLGSEFIVDGLVSGDDGKSTVVLVKADKYRYEVDYNRASSSDSPWHTRWKTAISPGNSFLVDVHSFYGTDVCSTCNAYMLDSTKKHTSWYTEFIMSETGIPVHAGSMENYITITAVSEYGIPAVLIELRESLDRERLKKVCTSFARALVKLKKQIQSQPFEEHNTNTSVVFFTDDAHRRKREFCGYFC